MFGSPSVPTNFLVISDTHNFEFEEKPSPFGSTLPKVDVLLHCGNLTHNAGSSSYMKALRFLGEFDAELKLFMAGSHDSDLDEEYWKARLADFDTMEDHKRALADVKGELAAAAGVTCLEEGNYYFKLKNGASFWLYASPYSPAASDRAFGYEQNEDRFNGPSPVADGITSIAEHRIESFPLVDIVMTHGPPKKILDACSGGNVGCEHLLRAVGRARPRMHCFGRVHEGNGLEVMGWDTEKHQPVGYRGNPYPSSTGSPIQYGKETLMVNAAVMDAKNRPVNSPWLISLELPTNNFPGTPPHFVNGPGNMWILHGHTAVELPFSLQS
ncbi:hypothetical protein ACLMJK_005217 [Lecanora helva]